MEWWDDEDTVVREELEEIQLDEGPPSEEMEESWLEPGPWSDWGT